MLLFGRRFFFFFLSFDSLRVRNLRQSTHNPKRFLFVNRTVHDPRHSWTEVWLYISVQATLMQIPQCLCSILFVSLLTSCGRGCICNSKVLHWCIWCAVKSRCKTGLLTCRCSHWRSGDRIPVGARFSSLAQAGPGAHPDPYTMGTGSYPVVKRSGRGVEHPPTI